MTSLLSGILAAIACLGEQGVLLAPPPPGDLIIVKQKSRWQESSSLNGLSFYDTLGKKLNVWWEHADGAQLMEEFALSYYPTAAIRLPGPPLRYCVAGRTRRGFTVIEVMYYTPPFEGQDMNGNTVLSPSSIDQVTDVYNEKTVGRDMVVFLKPTLQNSELVLLQFYDSKDLYSIRLVDETYQLVASATAGQGGLYVPDLATESHNLMWLGDHLTDGYLCVLTNTLSDLAKSIVLRDSDKDGVYDSYLTMTASQWSQASYSDGNNFLVIE